jgi:hypothetical protein
VLGRGETLCWAGVSVRGPANFARALSRMRSSGAGLPSRSHWRQRARAAAATRRPVGAIASAAPSAPDGRRKNVVAMRHFHRRRFRARGRCFAGRARCDPGSTRRSSHRFKPGRGRRVRDSPWHVRSGRLRRVHHIPEFSLDRPASDLVVIEPQDRPGRARDRGVAGDLARGPPQSRDGVPARGEERDSRGH